MVKPPDFAVKNAKKALKCLEKGSEAMTQVGRNRARQLANRRDLCKKDLADIASFKRHMNNAKFSGDICKDRGAVAWLGWGNGFKNGKPVASMSEWAKRKLDQMEKNGEK